MSELTKYTPEEFLKEEADDNNITSLLEVAANEIGFIKQHKNEEAASQVPSEFIREVKESLDLYDEDEIYDIFHRVKFSGF